MKRMRNASENGLGKKAVPSIAPGTVVIALVLLLLFVLLFFLMFRYDMLPPNLAALFHSSDGGGAAETGTEKDLILTSEDLTFSEENLFTPDYASVAGNRDRIVEILRSINSYSCYRQVLAVSFGKNTVDLVTILRDGDRFRVESAGGTLAISDGRQVYLRRKVSDTFAYEHLWELPEGQFTVHTESGLPTIEEIIEEMTETPGFRVDEGEKMLQLEGFGDGEILRSCGISYETGIVLYDEGRNPEGELVYRRYTTEYELDPEFSADAFRLPSMN